MNMHIRTVARVFLGAVVLAGAAVVLGLPGAPRAVSGQEQAPVRREFSLAARKFAFEPGRIEVNQNDLVKITLRSHDIAHSFTIDAYRIAKRVSGGQSVTFEFRADQAGTFPFYCNLRQDDGCKGMHGEMIVRAR
jgi:nitrous-oxide reductase